MNLFDPRTKMIFVFLFSLVALLSENLLVLNVALGLGCVFALICGVDILSLLKRVRKFLGFFFMLIVIQSLFTREGTVIVEVLGIHLLTDIGLIRGIHYLYRMGSVLLAGAIIASSNLKDNLQGLVQLGLPYDLGFICAMGIRFLPIFMEDMKQTHLALNLRGIDMTTLKLNERLRMVSILFLPTVVSAIQRAKELALSAEARGYKIQGKRSYFRHLTFSVRDYVAIVLSSMVFISLMIWKG